MKQLLLKEWREHFKVALIGMMILTLLLIVNVKGPGLGNGLQPLVYDGLLKQTAFFVAIFGFLLGWLQTQSEKHPDLRAFLLHRPVARTTIFWSKLISGLGRYAVGAGLPLAGLVIFVLIPGEVAAPFEWAMVLPATNLLLLGLVFHGAGMLTGIRPARWYGSRIFGLGPAMLAAILMFTFPQYWQALTLILIAEAMLVAAVWGGFQTGGYYRDQLWPGKLGLSLTCALASLLVCGLAAALTANFLLRPQLESYRYYELNQQGTVFQVVRNGPDTPAIEDLNGHPVLDAKTGKFIKQNDFAFVAPAISTSVEFHHPGSARSQYWGPYFSSLHFFAPGQHAGHTLWYLFPDGRLEGYDTITRRPVGTLEPADSSAAPATVGTGFRPPDRYTFPSYNDQTWLLASDRSLYLVDGEKRTVQTLLATTNGNSIGGYSVSGTHELLVVTRDFIRLYNPENRLEFQVPGEAGWSKDTLISVYHLEHTNQFAIQYNGLQVARVSAPGQILDRQNPPALPTPTWDDFPGKCCLLIFPPAIRVPVENTFPLHRTFDQWDALSIIPAVLSALIGWGLGRRYHFAVKDQISWTLFHLVFGIPGLLAFLSVQEWPAKEPCPQCKKRRLVDREHCEYCGGKFAPPERNGTEIFEPLAVESSR